jgi:hypothetical protein
MQNQEEEIKLRKKMIVKRVVVNNDTKKFKEEISDEE